MDTSYEPLFSVIIPTYNSAKNISGCIKSITDQSFSDWEILVIDNLSADDTLAKVSSFKSEKINIISEKDNGVYDAMNKGIQMANGKWLYFLGSDDRLYNNEVLKHISSLIKKHSQCRIIFGNVITSNNTIEKYTNYGFTELLDRCVCHQAIFYSRELFESRPYRLQYGIAADWDFNMQVFKPENHPLYADMLIAHYSLEGMSGNWRQHPDYLQNFANKKAVIRRYKSSVNLYFYYAWYHLKKIGGRLAWMFR
jgi:glycosyltransferase involved in cell wall biosynthesis